MLRAKENPMRAPALGILLSLFAITLAADPLEGPVSFRDSRWQIEAKKAEIEEFRGREALAITEGIAAIDAGFRDGVIEFDITVPDARGFHGVAFRIVDPLNYEHVYIRSHLSGKPDATQYTPVFNGVSGWQIYTGERYALPLALEPERWMHVRIVVDGTRMELVVDGQSLVFPQLQREPVAGALAFESRRATARFANLVITPGTPQWRAGSGAPVEPVPPGAVARWRVSQPFAESRLDVGRPLRPNEWRDLSWQTLATDVRGFANLARLHEAARERNTVFAAVTLRAPRAALVPVRFGFSDRVVAFLNGRPLYRGNDLYLSRDYRFLGSTGLFDELVLPLERGDNALWLAVSEDFGGWSVGLEVPLDAGVTVVEP